MLKKLLTGLALMLLALVACLVVLLDHSTPVVHPLDPASLPTVLPHLDKPLTATDTLTWTVAIPFVVRGPSSTPNCDDVIVNGDFEAPLPGHPWTGVANTSSAVYADARISSARAHAGTQSARLGSPSVNGYWNELLQTVQLPAAVVSATLTYWRYLDTSETSTTVVYDIFTVGLESEQGIQIMPPLQIDNTSSGRGAWVQRSVELPNAAAYSAQRLWVTFKGATDSNLPSSLYVDDVHFIVCVMR